MNQGTRQSPARNQQVESTSPKKIHLYVTFVYLLMVAVSVYSLVLKREALKFHTRDYNYFIEQAARLTDPKLTKQFALNIEGYNFLGLQGLEGVQSLTHAIHAEYFRYTYVILYGLFQDTLPIYIFYSSIFFLPVLYFAFLRRSQPGRAWMAVSLFTLLYTLFPAAIYAVTSDLRPRILFISAWCLMVLAIFYDRPFIEKLAFFGLLLGIREEGILLGTILIAINFLQMKGKPGRWVQTIVFLGLTALALAAFLAFMAWGRYTRVDSMYDPLHSLGNLFSARLPFTIGVSVLIVFCLGFVWFKKREQFNHLLILLLYSTAIGLTGIQMARESVWWSGDQMRSAGATAWEIYLEFITSSKYAITFYMILLPLVLLLDNTRNLSRKFLFSLLSLLCVAFAVTTLASTTRLISDWTQNIPDARLVWDFVEDHDRYRAQVLVDYDTYQAFYNYDNVIVYNRLPLWDTLPEKRFYPQNKEALVRLIQERMEYAVISQGSLGTVSELAQMAGVQVTVIASNDRYVVLKFHSSPDARGSGRSKLVSRQRL